MRTVSFQGTQLSESQRRNLALQQQVKAPFMNAVLTEQFEKTMAVLEQRKAQGVKPEKFWFVDRDEKGTTCIADWMGF
ncbi:hypothetical protein [Pseudomonas anguilliseptica]|uniref:hypothetical protein n=1 Tax=Pseudomonas anguilliseptica TaxID=53406 RepID=UPI00325B0F09